MSILDSVKTIAQIVTMVSQYGAPAVRKILDEIERKDDPTIEEVQGLLEMLNDPESYFQTKTKVRAEYGSDVEEDLARQVRERGRN